MLRRPFESAQYAALAYRQALLQHGLIGSMGRRGNRYDNAMAESFMKTMKVEAVYPMAYETFEDVSIPFDLLQRCGYSAQRRKIHRCWGPVEFLKNPLLLGGQWNFSNRHGV
jgi:transposase InsO family protein